MVRKVQLFVFIVVLSVHSVFAQDAHVFKPTEYQIKAAFLYQFAKFVQWPDTVFADSSKQIVIGILGEDPFGGDLDNTVQGKFIHDREIRIKRIDRLENVQDCQILFISGSETKKLPVIFARLHHSNILTVGDTEGFSQEGGIINFIRKDNKIHFEINVDAAQKAGLKLSSKLLNLAKIVESNP
jgi:hypothetical protein